MAESRTAALVAKLKKGGQKTQEILGNLADDQWQAVLYTEPHSWTVRDLLAHFLSAEEALVRIGQDMASGGPGVPEGFDFEAFNVEEQRRLVDRSPQELLGALNVARQATLAWVHTLKEEDLDHRGQHPVLGEISLETFVTSIYGHQLLHMRDLQHTWERSR
ncbi:MAG: DinB family protein [Anaerolineae bacterium]|nr:MAG: DinB family protein [Anaerolineae bacterium]